MNIDYWKMYLDEQLGKDFYNLKDSSGYKFNTKKFTFDSIIADAIIKGPLKTYSVGVDVELVCLLKRALNTKWKSYITDIIFMMIKYKIESINNFNIYQIYNRTEVSNWLRKRLNKEDITDYLVTLSNLGYYGEDIISSSTKKIFFHETLIKHINLEFSNLLDTAKFINVIDTEGHPQFRKKVREFYSKKVIHNER